MVHVVRDSRAVAYSWNKLVRRPDAGIGAADGQEYMDTSPRRSAMLWNTLNLGFHLLAARGIPTTLIRFEDFIAAPVARCARSPSSPGPIPTWLAGGWSLLISGLRNGRRRRAAIR